MTSPWIVTTNTDRITLDAARHGELTFTVTNATDAADQVVFEAVPGEGVDRAALSVDNPGRRIAGGASAAFLVGVSLGPQVAPGRYELYGQAYSAHLAPEETLGRSGRVVFDLAPEPKKKPFPWWILVAAGLVVVVLVVVLTIALSGKGTPKAVPSATPSRTPPTVPALVGQKQDAATSAVTAAGLKLTVRIQHVPDRAGTVVEQTPPAGTVVAAGSSVDILVAVNLDTMPQPVGTAPTGAIASTTNVAFSWTAAPGINHYLIVVSRQYCQTVKVGDSGVRTICFFAEVQRQMAAGTGVRMNVALTPANLPERAVLKPQFQWQLADVDDFGNAGTLGGGVMFTIPA